MYRARVTLAIVAVGCLSGCSTYGGAPVYGAFYRVSSSDLRQTVAAAQSCSSGGKIYACRVISADEVRLYYTPDEDGSYCTVRRTNGRWRTDGGAIVITHPIR
jgi:hypothetical protein